MKNELKKLHLGCGKDYREGFVNVDIDKESKADIIINLEKKLPYKDDRFDYIYSRHVIEHLHPEKIKFVMDEIYRICKNNAIVEIHVPHFSCGKTYQSYNHLTPMSYFTFDCGEFSGFKILKRRLNFMRSELPYTGNNKLNKIAKLINPIFSFVPNKIPFIYERFLCWIYPVEEVSFKMAVVKSKITDIFF